MRLDLWGECPDAELYVNSAAKCEYLFQNAQGRVVFSPEESAYLALRVLRDLQEKGLLNEHHTRLLGKLADDKYSEDDQ